MFNNSPWRLQVLSSGTADPSAHNIIFYFRKGEMLIVFKYKSKNCKHKGIQWGKSTQIEKRGVL